MMSIIAHIVPRMNFPVIMRNAFRRAGYVIKPMIAVTNQMRRTVMVVSGGRSMSTHQTYVKNLNALWAFVYHSTKYVTVFETVWTAVMKMDYVVCS